MEEEIKSTMEEYQKLLSESQLAIKNLSEKKAVTTSRVWKCVGVAAAGLTVATCAMAYVVHPTIGSFVATAAGIGVAKAGAAGAAAGVAKAGAAAAVAKAGAAAGVAKAGAVAGVAKAGTAAGVAKAGTAAGVAKAGAAGAAVARLSISWAKDMQATIGHLDTALRALKNINRTAGKLDMELNGTKSSLYNLETAIQLAGERLDDLSESSKKPLGLRANLVSFLRYVLLFLGILVYFPGLLADDPESLNQVREKGRIVVQNSDSVNEELQKLGLKINFLRQQVEDA
jgi:flagellin-like hook-associated protein FlgL